jgi:hypothetical protein
VAYDPILEHYRLSRDDWDAGRGGPRGTWRKFAASMRLNSMKATEATEAAAAAAFAAVAAGVEEGGEAAPLEGEHAVCCSALAPPHALTRSPPSDMRRSCRDGSCGL